MEQPFGKYVVLKKLATGGMAEVLLARQTGIEGFKRHVVIKRILPHLADDPEFVEMFLNEARIAAQFNHPNIAQIYELERDPESGAYYIAMEFVHGEDLARIMRKAWGTGQWMAFPISIRVVISACEGLYYAHGRTDEQGRPLKVVHRDISPQNILIGFDGSVKVMDFGIAKARDTASVTKSGSIKGKFAYMAPEQAKGQPIDHRADIFAIGLTLYELLTGTRPLKKDSEVATLQAAMECKIPAPSKVADCPPELDPIVMKAIARDVEERYSDARQFGMALEEFLVSARWIASSAQISELMATLFADRLEEEAKLGRPDPNSEDLLRGPSIPGLKSMPPSKPAIAAVPAPPSSPSRSGSLGNARERPPSRVSPALTDEPKRSDPNMTTMARQPTRPGLERQPTGTGGVPPARVNTRTAPRIRQERDERAERDEREERDALVAREEDLRPEPAPRQAPSSAGIKRRSTGGGVGRAERAGREEEPEQTAAPPPPKKKKKKRPAEADLRPLPPKKRWEEAPDDEADPAVAKLDQQLEDLEALRRRNKKRLVGVLMGTVAAVVFVTGLLFSGTIRDQFRKVEVDPGGQGVFLNVDANIQVTVFVKHHPDEADQKKDRYIEEIGQAPLRKATGAHLRDIIILKNDPLGAYHEHEIAFGAPGSVITITKEFQKGALKLTVHPKKVSGLSVMMNGQEIGKYPGVKIELYEGQHELELQGEQLRAPVPFAIDVKPGQTVAHQLDVTKELL